MGRVIFKEDVMSYYFSKRVDGSFEEVVNKVKAELKKEGFGVLSDLNVKKTLKEKLGVDFGNYRILGACNPTFSHEAFSVEDKVGTMLPCNVIVQEWENDIEVAAVDPVASMMAIENPKVKEIAQKIQEKLKGVIDNV